MTMGAAVAANAVPTGTPRSVPALFVSHGAPTFAIEPGEAGPALGRWGRALRQAMGPALRGVVVMSPHWMAPAPAVGSGVAPATWHDFRGFPPALNALQYPAPGSPALASEVLALWQAAGISAVADDARPRDHGAWVPLMHLFPEAELPVVQAALPARAGPAEVMAMGWALRPLRAGGVLVVGSGSMTHNLGEFFGGARQAARYVVEFCRWVEAALVRGDTAALLDYRRQAPHAARAHPEDDHFLPFFFALGAADDGARPDYLTREVVHGMLAMDSFALAPPATAAA